MVILRATQHVRGQTGDRGRRHLRGWRGEKRQTGCERVERETEYERMSTRDLGLPTFQDMKGSRQEIIFLGGIYCNFLLTKSFRTR